MRRGGYAFFASRRCDIFTADLCNSIMPKTMLVVGGLGSVPGSVLGASLLTGLTELLRFMREKYLTLYAIIILVILIYQPGGLVALLGQAFAGIGGRRLARAEQARKAR